MTVRNVGNMQLSTPGDREILMSRVFNAPKKLVYEAYTKPELLKQWLGVHNGWKLEVCEIDLRAGGKYRYGWEGREGMKMSMGGEYREVVPNERLVATELFDEPWYPGGAVGTTTFVEQGGKTTLTTSVLYASKEAREAVLKTPMEQGMAMGLDKMAEILATLV
jgi:uncharacterized protein YndB with AHSA1/START domain